MFDISVIHPSPVPTTLPATSFLRSIISSMRLLQRTGTDELVNLHVLPLPDTERAIRRLVLHGRIPPPVEVEHVIRRA